MLGVFVWCLTDLLIAALIVGFGCYASCSFAYAWWRNRP